MSSNKRKRTVSNFSDVSIDEDNLSDFRSGLSASQNLDSTRNQAILPSVSNETAGRCGETKAECDKLRSELEQARNDLAQARKDLRLVQGKLDKYKPLAVLCYTSHRGRSSSVASANEVLEEITREHRLFFKGVDNFRSKMRSLLPDQENSETGNAVLAAHSFQPPPKKAPWQPKSWDEVFCAKQAPADKFDGDNRSCCRSFQRHYKPTILQCPVPGCASAFCLVKKARYHLSRTDMTKLEVRAAHISMNNRCKDLLLDGGEEEEEEDDRNSEAVSVTSSPRKNSKVVESSSKKPKKK